MNDCAPRLTRLCRAGALAAGLATGVFWGCADAVAERSPASAHTETPYLTDWIEIERLIADQKYQAAAERVADVRERARAAEDDESWARALVQEVQLRTALGGFERAVSLLREEPWPDAPRARAILNLFYAHGLVEYVNAYSWEIRQRERVDTGDEMALGSWTLEQLVAEAHRAYGAVWVERRAWGTEPLGPLWRYVEKNNYPPRIRGTLRDTVSYLWIELLANSSYWRPEHSNSLYRLDLEGLIEAAHDPADPSEASSHPLVRMAAVLGDLERWHREGGRTEAASEARLERLRRLHGALTQEGDRLRIREALEEHLEALDRELPWWSVGQSVLAELVRDEGRPDSLIRARELAHEAAAAHPGGVGGRRAAHLVAAIEEPEFALEAMAADGPARRSIRVQHKNLEALHFRAYRFDLRARVTGSRDYGLLPDHDDVETLLERGTVYASWTVELPPTPDYRMHATYVTPPIPETGGYLVMASVREDFSDRDNLAAALPLIVSDLVIVRRHLPSAIEITMRSGASGEALPRVEVALWKRDYRRGHRRVATRVTDGQGVARFERADERAGYFVVAQRGGEVAVDETYLTIGRRRDRRPDTAGLIYSDRSVYRPGQEVLWKLVAYRGEPAGGRLETLVGTAVEVELVDANGEVVDTASAETNEFGSASGSFTIPAGRLLGGWHLRSPIGARLGIRVEEYKRPTFEVAILDPERPLRLNREARLAGEARYYFGLPVVAGAVEWRVEREPIYPFWWYWRPRPAGERQTIAGGTADLDATGRFEIGFVAEADERLATDSGISYNYRLSAEVTDEGGETRSDSRVFRLGFVAVEASIEADAAFLTAGRRSAVEIVRSDLNGQPAAGEGRWKLIAVAQPESALLPAEQPVAVPEAEAKYATPGDRVRARWDTALSFERLVRDWADGPELGRGVLAHGDDGRATIDLEVVEPGVYRLHYTTDDAFGATFETQTELLVVGAGRMRLAAPAVLVAERGSVAVGEMARLFVHSGLDRQELVLEIFRDGQRTLNRRFDSQSGSQVIEIPVGEELRGGFGIRLTALRDHQLMTVTESVFVPWDDRRLRVEFESFRDLLRPGDRERWTVKLRGAEGDTLARGSAELLAYMYDRSLDLFAPHRPADPLALYPRLIEHWPIGSTLGVRSPVWRLSERAELPEYPHLRADRLEFFDRYPIGGPGRRGLMLRAAKAMPMSAEPADMSLHVEEAEARVMEEAPAPEAAEQAEAADPGGEGLREDFSETAFWEPHLRLGDDGSVAFEFTVPDSLTDWSVWVHALTRDLRSGSLQRTARSAKELMVRPYLPRFLREGDRAGLQVAVNNGSDRELSGVVDVDVVDPETGESVRGELGLTSERAEGRPFTVPPGGSATLEFPIVAPSRVGTVAFEVRARADDLADGELRPLPLLPGRMHLTQSRFAALRDRDRRELAFPDMAAGEDPTRIHQQLVVTLDAQLFYSVLDALPYLVDYPYQCTEQTLNRFLSTGIVGSLYDRYPAVERMARKFAERETRFERWDDDDPNRKMALEETPWLWSARGGGRDNLINVLDPRIARAERDVSLAELERAQTSLGGFPWWPGGPPSPYMTLYLVYGFSKALEFEVDVPRDMVVKAWGYLRRHYEDELRDLAADDRHVELVTFLNYVLSNYPDASWTGDLFSAEDQRRMLELSFRHWREHAPLIKGYLALTLARAGRTADARLVWDSVMDSARTTRDEGTFWAPEERAWLWYNDTIETHAFALRVLSELAPDDEQRHGLVQWLLMNKKLNHWKSTRATAEVVYSLVHYLRREGQLGVREAAVVEIGDRRVELVFEPDEYTGDKNQVVVAGDEIDPATMATTVVEKETPGFLFASATWHFSTERLPEEARGDLFAVTRELYRRELENGEWVLRPLAAEERLETGDQVEVHLVMRARHAAEYVHLRDPRAAGFEPESQTSGYRWSLGLGWFEEVRDSGTNFFIEHLPVGEFTLKYRLRAATPGTFKVAPATLQSMYAPEFTGYSAGTVVSIR